MHVQSTEQTETNTNCCSIVLPKHFAFDLSCEEYKLSQSSAKIGFLFLTVFWSQSSCQGRNQQIFFVEKWLQLASP